MILLLGEIVRYWPIITFVSAAIFYLGALHLMVKNSKDAITRLFDQTEKLRETSAAQKIVNDNFVQNLMKVEELQGRHEHESSMRYGELVARMDGIFKLLVNRGNAHHDQ